jgi:hypothetical protein
MFAVAITLIFGTLFSLTVLVFLLDRVEVPLHDQVEAPPTDHDMVLVNHAKRSTRSGRQQLN